MPLFMCQNGTLGVARFIVDSHDSHVGQRLMLMMKDNGHRNMCINLCGWMHVMRLDACNDALLRLGVAARAG